MKLTNFYSCLVLSTTLSSISCHKLDEKITEPVFQMGNKNPNIFLKTFNPAVDINAYPSHIDEYALDIDDDGVNDFALTSRFFNFHPGQNTGYSTISPLNTWSNISVFDTFAVKRYCNTDFPKLIIIYTNFVNHTCLPNAVDGRQDSSKVIYPVIYERAQEINDASLWTDSTVQLSFFDFSYYNNISTPTIVFGVWNDAKEKYVGVKLAKDGNVRYGWIKLSIDRHRHIKLHETGIQKN